MVVRKTRNVHLKSNICSLLRLHQSKCTHTLGTVHRFSMKVQAWLGCSGTVSKQTCAKLLTSTVLVFHNMLNVVCKDMPQSDGVQQTGPDIMDECGEEVLHATVGAPLWA